MNTSHTPGPWRTDVTDPAFVNYNVRTDETIICTMGIDMATEEEAANARLIAAAPELLEALQTLVQMTGNAGQLERFLDTTARAVIAKATNHIL